MADELKRVLGSVFLRDIRQVEPEKKGFLVGEDLRIYEDKDGYVLRFLKGTSEKSRAQYREKLQQGAIRFKVGADYTL